MTDTASPDERSDATSAAQEPQDGAQEHQGSQEGAQEPQESQEEPQEPQEPQESPTVEEGKAKYRRRAQEAEAERDQLRAELDTAQQQIEAVRQQIAETESGLARPASLWAAGVDVNTLFDDDGRLNHTRLTDAVRDAADRLGLTRAPRTPRPDPSAGAAGSAETGASWGAIFTRR